MNNTARAENPLVRREDWLSHGYSPIEEADKKVGSTLTTYIHSMFSYELDELPHNASTKARWGKLTPDEYELLDQPLRLATQLLESAPSSDAICSITDGAQRIVPNVLQNSAVLELQKHTHQLSVVRERAGKVLERLGKSITFISTDRDDRPESAKGAHGRTSPITIGYPEGIAITDQPLQRGLASVVVIDAEYLNMLKELHVESLRKQLMILKLNFEFALTICHEVIHAINFALASNLLKKYIEKGENLGNVTFNEPFYESQHVAELGYFWENHVFGGACLQSVPIPNNPVFLAEWPSWMLRDEVGHPERALPRARALKWLVSAYYIKNIQTQEFWNRINVQHPEDLLALRIRKRIAIKCRIPNGIAYDKTWDPEAPENRLGDYPRVPWTDSEPSPGGRLANETHREKDERLEKEERLDRERQMLSPGRDPDYLDRIDPEGFGRF